MKFIRTSDVKVAELLINLGFQKITFQDDIYTFLNSDKIQFSNDIDMKKIQYTNMLMF